MEFAKANLTPKAVSLRYFTKEREDHWKCKCGKVIQQKTNKGYSNLFNHIKGAHPDYADARDTSQPCNVNKKGRNAFSWIKWVCLGMKPFEFVENPLTREFTKLDPITVPTLKKYLEAVTRKTEAQISSKLPNQFSLIVDGWTKRSDHFVGVFAAWESSSGFESALLAFSPMLSETDFSAVEHKKFIEFVQDGPVRSRW